MVLRSLFARIALTLRRFGLKILLLSLLCVNGVKDGEGEFAFRQVLAGTFRFGILRRTQIEVIIANLENTTQGIDDRK